MSKLVQAKQYLPFTKGLFTEASSLNYPEGTTVDEDNFSITRLGIRERRLGLNLDTDSIWVTPTTSFASCTNKITTCNQPYIDPYYQYLVLSLNGEDYIDHSSYNVVLEDLGTIIEYGGYHGNGSNRFETSGTENNFQLFQSEFTIEFSLKRKSGNFGAIIGKTTYTDTNTVVPNYWLISMGVSGPLKFITRIGGIAGPILSSTIPPADGNFHTCKYTYDKSKLRYYLDGTFINEISISPFADTIASLGILCENSYAGVPYLGYGAASADYKCVLGSLNIWKGVVI